uniref:Uncharacterized protein n=1 Tax=Rhizophora mucronata TaxID=61149 RepID=A0A2P2NHW4_RHIMU
MFVFVTFWSPLMIKCL